MHSWQHEIDGLSAFCIFCRKTRRLSTSGFRKCGSWRGEYSSAAEEPTWPNTDSSDSEDGGDSGRLVIDEDDDTVGRSVGRANDETTSPSCNAGTPNHTTMTNNISMSNM